MTHATTGSQGLEGVVVAETALSAVDGAAGRLILRGYDVGELAGRVSFEDVAALFLDGELPDAGRRERMRAALARARLDAFERLPRVGDALDAASGMAALQAGVAHLAPTGHFRRDALALTGAVAVLASAWSRRARGLDAVPPDPRRSHAADVLAMVHGRSSPEPFVQALDTYLCTVVDHGMNASTFAARVVASTEADPIAAVVAAIGALSGRLHGGAPGPVLDMLDAVGHPDRAEAWVHAELEAGRRIMGMGHRVYRVRDPRAAVLEAAVGRFAAAGVASERLALARSVERAAEAALARRHPERPLRANVEFYTAVLLDALGLPRALFSPTFAVARVVGWCAHVAEQRRTGRLIRPSSRYVGPEPDPGGVDSSPGA